MSELDHIEAFHNELLVVLNKLWSKSEDLEFQLAESVGALAELRKSIKKMQKRLKKANVMVAGACGGVYDA